MTNVWQVYPAADGRSTSLKQLLWVTIKNNAQVLSVRHVLENMQQHEVFY